MRRYHSALELNAPYKKRCFRPEELVFKHSINDINSTNLDNLGYVTSKINL